MRRNAARFFQVVLIGATALSTAAASSPAQTAPPQVEPDSSVRLTHVIAAYGVTGKSVRDLRASIAANAPRSPEGARFGGFTTWELNWSYAGSEQRPNGCVPLTVNVYLDLSVQVPAWRDSSSAPVAVRNAWNRYVTALRTHETNHANIAIRGANWLASELRNLVTPVCSALQADAQMLAVRAALAIRSENDRYDVRTRHGVTEGVVLVNPVAPAR